MSENFRFEVPAGPLSGPRVKAGFHCHTVHSDGGLTVSETIARYREKGFACLGITDHRRVTRPENPPGDGFLFIESTENGGDPDIIGVGVENPVPTDLPLARRASLLAGQGGFTIAAHPSFCAVTPGEYLACPDLAAMEIFNAYCENAYGNGYALELWDMLLGQGKRILGVAGDDAHLNPRKRCYSDAGEAWVEAWASSPGREGVLEALGKGAFFSTTGPVFEKISVTENSVSIECSPAVRVRWRTWGRRGQFAGHVEQARPGEAITRCAVPERLRLDRYLRVELVDAGGRRAWSNPVFAAGEENR